MPLPEEIPLDPHHPAVRQYLSLIRRLQVLTPLSLLINIATVIVTTFLISPGLGVISKTHPTPISPAPTAVGVYIIAVFAGQIGYCVLLVLASKEETKQSLIKGAGFYLVMANWLMAAWAISWSLRLFVLSTILLAMMALILLYSNITLLMYHPPTRSRPFDTLFIHAPVRLFLLLPATLLLPQSILIMIGKTWDPTKGQELYNSYKWDGFAVVMITNIIALLMIIVRHDLLWCIAAVWINICIWIERPKSVAVQATTILFTVLNPVALVAISAWRTFQSRQGVGAIALPPDDELNEDRARAQEDHGENVGRVWS